MYSPFLSFVVKILTILAICGGLAGLVRPLIGIYFLVFLIPWDNYEIIKGTSSIYFIFPSIFLSSLFFKKIKLYKHNIVFIFLLLWEYITILKINLPRASLQKFLSQINIFLLIIVLESLLRDKKTLKIACSILVVSICALSFVQLMGVFFPLLDISLVVGGRVSLIGSYGANRISDYCSIGIPFYLLIKEIDLLAFKIVLTPWFVLPLLLVGVLLTGSKTGMVSIIVIYIILITNKKYLTKKILTYALIVILAYSSLMVSRYLFPNLKMTKRLQDLAKAPSVATTGRYDIFRVNLRMFIDNWFFGIGLGQEAKKYLEYARQMEGYRFNLINMDPHNTFMTVLIDLGIPGFILFFYIIFRFYNGNLKKVSKAPIEYKALFSAFFISSLSSTYIYSKFFWVLLCFASLIRRVIEADHFRND